MAQLLLSLKQTLKVPYPSQWSTVYGVTAVIKWTANNNEAICIERIYIYIWNLYIKYSETARMKEKEA